MNHQSIGSDHSGWVDGLACMFIEHAARCAPASLSGRLQEEWLAELAARRSAASRLRFATGCYWASRVIAREGWAGSPATLAAADNGRAVALWFAIHSGASRRAVVLFFIVALHVLLIYAFLTGLLVRIENVIPQSLEVSVSNEVLPHEQALPPPAPVLKAPKISIPSPVVDVNLPPDPAAIRMPARPQVTAPITAHTGSIRKKPGVWVLGGPGRGFPDTDDYYPQIARRLDEAGTTTVHVCVDARGKLTSTPLLSRSSGHATIDEAALRLARAGSGHYRPTTDNGVPVSSCFEYLIRFNLRD